MRIAIIVLAAGWMPLAAQELKLPASLERLADKAEKSVDVTMNKNMLQMAARFMSERDSDEAKTKKAIAGLESVIVRSYEFANEGEYTAADVDAVRAQIQPPAWSRIVGVRSKSNGENADVYFKIGANGQLGGIVVISAEPLRLTIVNVTGTIDPAQLGDLGGEFGIPRLDMGGMRVERKEGK